MSKDKLGGMDRFEAIELLGEAVKHMVFPVLVRGWSSFDDPITNAAKEKFPDGLPLQEWGDANGQMGALMEMWTEFRAEIQPSERISVWLVDAKGKVFMVDSQLLDKAFPEPPSIQGGLIEMAIDALQSLLRSQRNGGGIDEYIVVDAATKWSNCIWAFPFAEISLSRRMAYDFASDSDPLKEILGVALLQHEAFARLQAELAAEHVRVTDHVGKRGECTICQIAKVDA